MGFCRQVHQCTNIDTHSDPENPEKNPEEHESHSTPPQNLRLIVPRLEVSWIKTQGEIALDKE